MKNTAIGAITASLVITASVFLWGGCGRQGSGGPSGSGTSDASARSSASPSAVTPAVTSAEKNSFQDVAAHLDQGGNFYVYLSTEQWLQGLSGKISDFRKAFANMPGLDADQQQNVNKGFDLAANVVKHSGIEQVSGVGMSSIEWEQGLYRTRSVVHHYPGKNSGYIWSLLGAKPHDLDALNLMPDNTAFAFFSDVDVPMIWSAVEKEAVASGLPDLAARVQDAPDYFASVTGLKLKDVLDSLGGEYGFVLTLDDTHQVTVPIGARSVQMPDPELLVAVKVKNDVIYNAVKAKLAANPDFTERETNGIRMCSVPSSLKLPISLRPTIARSGDYLFVASTDSIIEHVVAVKSGDRPGIKSTDEFKKLARGIPNQGNRVFFMGQNLGDVFIQMQKQNLQATGTDGRAAAIQSLMGQVSGMAGPAADAYGVVATEDDGWIGVGNGNQDPSKAIVLMPVAVVAGAAGVALPAFAQARAAAQRQAARPRPQPGN